MAPKIMIADVNRTSYISAQDGVEVSLPYNEQSTARFVTLPGLQFLPNMRAPVLIYDDDSAPAIFGGLLWQRGSRGITKGMYVECECTGWEWYLSRTTIEGGTFTGTASLRQVCEYIQTFLAPKGFTLDPAQVEGPTATVKGFQWEKKYVADALRDLTVWSGGYVFSVSPLKVWKMEKPALTETAPIVITDDTSQIDGVECNWTESSEHYAEKVTGIFGGTGVREHTESWVVDAGVIAAGYVQTGPSATPTGGLVAKINTVVVSVGAAGSGAVLVWNWKLHRLTPGTYVPTLGDVVALTFTAQFPFRVTRVSGVPDPIEYLEQKDDITDLATAEAWTQGKLDAMYQTPRIFEINAMHSGSAGPHYFTPGLRPGNVIAINSAYRESTQRLALITRVQISIRPGRDLASAHVHYHATASDGIYQGSGLSFWRSLASGASASPAISVTFAPGVNPVEIPTAGALPTVTTPIYLGGSLTQPIASTAWVPVESRVPFKATRSFTGLLRVWAAVKGGSDAVTFKRPFPMLALTNRLTIGEGGGGGTVDVRLQKTSGTPATVAQFAAPVGTSSLSTIELTGVSLVEGETYELQMKTSAADVWGYAQSVLEPVSV